ncbi:MAG: hypothetical protein C3F11_11650 [Methylocystaceae bacterium]|nr:MAG: hypothetical protein C3F11_11650 [Methylocystaceae bacterium]
MRRGWFRLSRWGVRALGAGLALAGFAAMWDGWDKIQIERGWSLFIAGSVAVSGGVVTLALAAVLSRLDHAIFAASTSPSTALPSSAPPSQVPRADPAPAQQPAAPEKEFAASLAAALDTVATRPVEVDRHVDGDTTYVMFSDGGVEVRNSGRARRFSSLAELKAQVGEHA